MDTASIAVWDVPMPVVAGESFAIKVGVKSHASAALTGGDVKVCDRDDNVVASGRLGGAPWPGTEALYWVELSVPAPASTELAEFTVRSANAASRFSVAVVPKPEHRLIVEVAEQGSAVPLEGVEIRLGAFQARTDTAGRATLKVCKGEYQLEVWRAAYAAPPTWVDIRSDTRVDILIVHVPEDHPDARWVR